MQVLDLSIDGKFKYQLRFDNTVLSIYLKIDSLTTDYDFVFI